MRKRLVFRVDDIGYTEAYDLGVFKVLDGGIGSSADVMLDSPHTAEALRKLRDYPWLSIGWHRHLWESPVLPPQEVPSLVDEDGRFRWRHRHPERMAEATYEDAYREFEAELKRCHEILGRYPDVAGAKRGDNALEDAYQDILDRFGITYGFYSTMPDHHAKVTASPAYADLNIYSRSIQTGRGFDLRYFNEYDPLKTMTDVQWSDREEIFFYGWHPGYCDDHIMKESTCSLHRCKEHEACMSDEFRNWIIQNRIELISMTDALHNTDHFQNHLKEVNSPLWIGNM